MYVYLSIVYLSGILWEEVHMLRVNFIIFFLFLPLISFIIRDYRKIKGKERKLIICIKRKDL